MPKRGQPRSAPTPIAAASTVRCPARVTASVRVTLAPPFRHGWQDRQATPGACGRFGSNPVEESELGLETGTLRICAHKGKFEVLSEAIYSARKEAAARLTAADIARAEAAGLNL